MAVGGHCLLDNFRERAFPPAFIQGPVSPHPQVTRAGNPNCKTSDSMPAAQDAIIIAYEYGWLQAALGLHHSSVNLVL